MIRKTTTFAELLAACPYIKIKRKLGSSIQVAAWLEARLAKEGIQLSVKENIDNTVENCVMHHFHCIAMWVLTSDPPQEVHICCHCGERINRIKPLVKKHLIPDSCGKFHPERPGHCYTMMELAEKKEKQS